MTAHWHKPKPLARALRRACHRHADQALASLRQAAGPDSVHETRKELKKLRAVFRLARGSLRPKPARRAAETMRLAAKPLAGVRDARVTRQALSAIAGRDAAQKFPRIAAALEENSQREQRHFADLEAGAMARVILRALREQLRRLKFRRARRTALQSCLRKSYRRARRACQLAALSPSAAHLHAWRKRVKALSYQLHFICPHWPPRTQALVDGLEKLSERLGDAHDAALLQHLATELGGAEATALNRLIVRRQAKLTTEALRLGENLFSRRAGKMCAQIKRDAQRGRG